MAEEEDLTRILEYIDGELDEDARIAFEVRLANEPELAEHFESFSRVDALQRVASASRRGATSSPAARKPVRRTWRPYLVAAAAAAVLLALWGLRRFPAERPPGFRVCAVPSSPTLRGFHAELGWTDPEAEELPPGFGMRGEGGEEVSPETYLGRVLPRIDRWVRESLDEDQERIEADYFLLPVQPEEMAHAVVLLLAGESGELMDADGGGGGWAYPDDRPWSDGSGRLEAGGIHMLPRDSVERLQESGEETISYSPGFLVPRGVGELLVLVGLRRGPLDEALRARLDEVVPAPGPGRGPVVAELLTAWLAGEGFTVHRLRVRER